MMGRSHLQQQVCPPTHRTDCLLKQTAWLCAGLYCNGTHPLCTPMKSGAIWEAPFLSALSACFVCVCVWDRMMLRSWAVVLGRSPLTGMCVCVCALNTQRKRQREKVLVEESISAAVCGNRLREKHCSENTAPLSARTGAIIPSPFCCCNSLHWYTLSWNQYCTGSQLTWKPSYTDTPSLKPVCTYTPLYSTVDWDRIIPRWPSCCSSFILVTKRYQCYQIYSYLTNTDFSFIVYSVCVCVRLQ